MHETFSYNIADLSIVLNVFKVRLDLFLYFFLHA